MHSAQVYYTRQRHLTATYPRIGRSVRVVLHSDYAALERECEELRKDAAKWKHDHDLLALKLEHWGQRAESAEAKLQRIMEWARGRCTCCEYDRLAPTDAPCFKCLESGSLRKNWTPPTLWEEGKA